MATLKELFKARRLSQAEVGRRTGLSEPAISRAVCGHPVKRTTLYLICQCLDVSMADVEGVKLSSAADAAAKRKKRA